MDLKHCEFIFIVLLYLHGMFWANLRRGQKFALKGFNINIDLICSCRGCGLVVRCKWNSSRSTYLWVYIVGGGLGSSRKSRDEDVKEDAAATGERRDRSRSRERRRKSRSPARRRSRSRERRRSRERDTGWC